MDREFKFSLPGIAFDEPDTYENEPLPRILKNDLPEDADNENINICDLDPEKAYDKFKTKNIKFSKINNFLEENLQSLINPKGYGTIEYDPEIHSNETPSEKYLRIQHDLDVLYQQIQNLGKENTAHLNGSTVTGGDVANVNQSNCNQLYHTLSCMNERIKQLQYGALLNNELFAADNASFEALIQTVISGDRKVLETINKFQNSIAQKPDKIKEDSAEPNSVTFELYCDPGVLKNNFNLENQGTATQEELKLKISDLTQRLNRVTSLVMGENGDITKINDLLQANGAPTSMMDSITQLQSKMTLLDRLAEKSLRNEIETYCKDLTIRYKELFPNPPPTSSMAATTAGSSSLLTSGIGGLTDFQKFMGKDLIHKSSQLDANNVPADSNVIEQYSAQDKVKINKLYDMVKSVQAVTSDLPDIYKRLALLNNVQKKGTEFLSGYEGLVAVQETLQQNLLENKNVMEQLKSEFSENVKIIKENCMAFEGRLTQLLNHVKNGT